MPAAGAVGLSSISLPNIFSVGNLKDRLKDRIQSICREAFCTLVATVSEFYAMAYSTYIYRRGRGTHFKYFGVNPDTLSDAQAKRPAILFLHGIFHNQSGILPAAKRFQEEGIGPVFTVNLDYTAKREVYEKTLGEKIAQIQALYKAKQKELQLTFLCHSFGASVAARYTYCQKPPKGITVTKIISIAGRLVDVKSWFRGTPKNMQETLAEIAHSKHESPPYHIIASDKDWRVPFDATKFFTKGGEIFTSSKRSHLGILYATSTHDNVIQLLAKT